jgi:uncharacterized protein involved in response to NO
MALFLWFHLVYCWLLHGQICLIGLNFLCLFCFRMYWADFQQVYKKKYSEDVIRNGILGAMGIFAIMFVVGALVPVLGYRVGVGLFFALLSLLIARIVSLFSEKEANTRNGFRVRELVSLAYMSHMTPIIY